MRRVVMITILTSIAMVLAFQAACITWFHSPKLQSFTVGFIYDNDESTSYTYNFALAKEELEYQLADQFDGRLQVLVKSNVTEDQTTEAVRKLAEDGCSLIFTNGYSGQFKDAADSYPDIQFCQVSYYDNSREKLPANYHTFKGEAYQGRYICGMAAGLKLDEMIQNGLIGPEDAYAGFVAAHPTTEVISGFTAFALGMRSIVPEARLRVIYTGSWSNYALEKAAASKLIREGCFIISQHSDTIGPASACEEYTGTPKVYHIGYNQSMMNVAPTAALVSCRINWAPYVVGAAEAVLSGEVIEKRVNGAVHGKNDMSGGFDRGWVEILDLNKVSLPDGADQMMEKTIEMFRKGTIEVFKGDYTGTDPENPEDTIDLRKGYDENLHCSSPTFHYILDDVIEILE